MADRGAGRWRRSQSTSRPNDHTSEASASTVNAAETPAGRSPEQAASRTTPCSAATVLRAKPGGSGALSHGSTHAAATKAYRMAPITSTHGPSVRASRALSTRIRKASTSMSKRAPRADEVPVRRATLPSTASRASATAVTPVSSGVPCATPPATMAATPPTSTARARVTWSAGPSERRPARRRPAASSAQVPAA